MCEHKFMCLQHMIKLISNVNPFSSYEILIPDKGILIRFMEMSIAGCEIVPVCIVV